MEGKFRIKGYEGDIEALRLAIEDHLDREFHNTIVPKLFYQSRSNSACIYFSIMVKDDDQLMEVMKVADRIASQKGIVLTMPGHCRVERESYATRRAI